MSDRDASLDEASNIAFKALKEKPPAKPVDIYFVKILQIIPRILIKIILF